MPHNTKLENRPLVDDGRVVKGTFFKFARTAAGMTPRGKRFGHLMSCD